MAKTKLTPETQEKICNALRAGNHAKVAAEFGGVSESTFYGWLNKGEAANRGIYRKFLESVKKAEADAETVRVARISQAGQSGVWQADAWWLERKFPERWGRRVQEITGAGGGPVEVKSVVIYLPDNGRD